jgi:nitrile hydratase accessory protein
MTKLPGMPTTVFTAPWQAQIFALVVALERRGLFPWADFQAALTAAIAAAPIAEQGPDFYYRHWLQAAEQLLANIDQIRDVDLATRVQALRATTPVHHHHP